MQVGVLGLQGGFEPHVVALRALGHEVERVRYPCELEGLEGLVLPGGESSTQLDLLGRAGLLRGIEALVRRGGTVLATCAGLILAAREVRRPRQKSLGFLDVVVERNAFGRQLESFEARSDRQRLPLVFIRAPRITDVGSGSEVLDTLDGEPILVREGNVVGATFHPELTGDPSVARIAFGERNPR